MAGECAMCPAIPTAPAHTSPTVSAKSIVAAINRNSRGANSILNGVDGGFPRYSSTSSDCVSSSMFDHSDPLHDGAGAAVSTVDADAIGAMEMEFGSTSKM